MYPARLETCAPPSLLILTRHLGCFKATPWAGGSSPWGLWPGVRVLQPWWWEEQRRGPLALAGLTLLYQLSKIPGLPRRCQPPCPPDLVLTPQLTSWLLYIYFLPPPSHPLPSLCLSQKQQRRTGSSSDASLLQSPAKNAGLKWVLPRKPCLYPPKYPRRQLPRGEGPALLWSPAVKMLSQPLEHLAAASLSALCAKPRPSREMG